MSDKFFPISAKQLLQIILKEYNTQQSIFGIPKELFFNPKEKNIFSLQQFNQTIDSPLGVAAGPHSQMAQNIIASWLMGARYIELKTVQTLDEIEIAKPCIDMQDEGYNCEWSQELMINESFREYLHAWVIIHILNHKFGWNAAVGTIFNMSVGYNLDGILNENVQWFFNKMNNCKSEINALLKELRPIYADIDLIEIPQQISNNITLSTMHGCPANEIEDIAKYLMEEKALHTFVKLNPTLLGPEKLRDILNNQLNFKAIVPDIAFEHDLKYGDALKIIRSLQAIAKNEGLHFGLKLTNTLETINNKSVFGKDIDMMYMSGRSLHPVSIQLAKKLQDEFMGELQLSFSGGIDAFNVSDVLSCGFKTVTVCSDILKPGGYMRLNQYFEEIIHNFKSQNANSITEFVIASGGNPNLNGAASENLKNYAEAVLNSAAYKRTYLKVPDIKTTRNLSSFDCISAPCRDTCATHQDIPDYLKYSAENQFDKAYEVILKTNPFPSVTGMICDHLCQNKCTRVNYDESLLIREVKRFVSEQDEVKLQAKPKNGLRVGVLGAGPAGLSCAYYLSLAGFTVDVFEKNSKAGGMVQFAIPGFRLTDDAINRDIKRITDLGVTLNYDTKVDEKKFAALKADYDYLFVGVGAQLSASYTIEGIEAKGVLDSLQFLFNAKQSMPTGAGVNIVIIGGGNTAMDAARTANRLVGNNGKVSILYRRTLNEMPADHGEILAVLEEGIDIIELVNPKKIIQKDGKLVSLICTRMELKNADSSGRAKPVEIADSEFEIFCDTLIPSVGQRLDIDFVSEDLLAATTNNYLTQIENVFIGGDALRNAATAIKAIGDGRKAAEQIGQKAEIEFNISISLPKHNKTKKEHTLKRAKRVFAPRVHEFNFENRKNFKLVSETLEKNLIVKEASRCLHCDEICNICTTVCPNFANYSYEIDPFSVQLHSASQLENGEIETNYDRKFEISQKYQILNIANFCNECGNCSTFCPTNSAPYKEKPKFYLTSDSYDLAENGYFIENEHCIVSKQMNKVERLESVNNTYVYTTSDFVATLQKDTFSILNIWFKTEGSLTAQINNAVEMHVLLQAAKGLYGFRK